MASIFDVAHKGFPNQMAFHRGIQSYEQGTVRASCDLRWEYEA